MPSRPGTKPFPPPDSSPTVRFEATLLRSGSPAPPEEACIPLPSLDPDSDGIEGTLHGFPFRSRVVSDNQGNRTFRVSGGVQKAAGVTVGDRVSVEITRIGDEPECRLPADLREALAAVPRAQSQWTSITPLARRDWILWISSAKQPDTRRARIGKACSMLSTGKRRPCCFGGLNWLTKDLPPTEETWRDLPKTALAKPRPPRP